MAMGPSMWGANLIVVKMAVGPSAPPIMPSDAASLGVKPSNRDTSNTAKMPN